MSLHKADVTITLLGPVLTKSSEPGAFGVDAVCARNAAGNFIIPWTLIKGRIRDGWRELFEIVGPNLVPDPRTIFGPESDGKGKDKAGNLSNPEGNFTRYNTRFTGTDFVITPESKELLNASGDTRTRISQDPNRHAASEDMLQVMECPFISGEKYEFAGTIQFDSSDIQADDIKRMIIKGMRWTGVLGSQTSMGFGRIAEINWHHQETRAAVLDDREKDSNILWLHFTSDRPLCITEARSKENLFASSIVIPGSVIKGAFAAQWKRNLGHSDAEIKTADDPNRPELANAFDRIRISHARPSAKDSGIRPVVIPLSFSKKDKETYKDIALHPDPSSTAFPLEFQSDWKDHDQRDVNAIFGWPKYGQDYRKDLRVRTAIDPSIRRAKEGNLFAYETIIPEGLEWHCEVHFAGLSGQNLAKARAHFIDLLKFGLRGVGKTKANLQIQLASPPLSKVTSFAEPRDGRYVLVLQTAALLAPPSALNGLRNREQFLAAYQSVFSELSSNSLILERIFASQILQGGRYLHRRFQEKNKYQPYALTDQGSVFVLKIVEGKEILAKQSIEQWMKNGLPVPVWAKAAYSRNGRDGAYWANNPYVPENGFGEVAVNLKIHFEGGIHA
jgi:hypothetical protein